MSLKKIMAITGMPGLYKVIAQTRNGFIAESLADKKRFPVTSNQQVSMLADISMFTTAEDVKLTEIFKTMKAMSDGETQVHKDADGATLKNAFKKILPGYDEERVYASDIKKVFKWYNLLKDVIDFNEFEEETTIAVEAAATPTPTVEQKEEAPAKKTRAKAPKKETAEGEEKPKRKTKKTETGA